MPSFADLTINMGTLIAVLYAIVGVMLIVVLYHAIFIMVDLRKISRRFEDITSQVEAMILKPLSMADQAVQWALEFVEHKRRQHQKKHVDEKK
jgi:cell shape-determining protein MreC